MSLGWQVAHLPDSTVSHNDTAIVKCFEDVGRLTNNTKHQIKL